MSYRDISFKVYHISFFEHGTRDQKWWFRYYKDKKKELSRLNQSCL